MRYLWTVKIGNMEFKVVDYNVYGAINLAKNEWIKGLDDTELHLADIIDDFIYSIERTCIVNAIDTIQK